MKFFVTLDEIRDPDHPAVGGKAFALSRLKRSGFRIPHSICVPAWVYDAFVEESGLRERIMLELNRKDLKEMRWEEIWDAGLRIRSMFLTKSLPGKMEASLREALDFHFPQNPVAVRSSSPQEDSATSSFAGLHESFINVHGAQSILDHIRLVWASLWSDASLLYRQELGLEVHRSSMAVLIQELIHGACSGVLFSRNPNDPSQVVLEAVHGLNQGLVDGQIEPDRWLIDRDSKRIVFHRAPERKLHFVPLGSGVRAVHLPQNLALSPPLEEAQVQSLLRLALQMEDSMGSPQDVEWTLHGESILVLQSRPITTLPSGSEKDQRKWYLSLRRSFENLQELRQRIEEVLIPAMTGEYEAMTALPLSQLPDGELAREIEHRQEAEKKWTNVYWDEFIPFAHGMRLFGQVYNDTMRPADPYEFLRLLGNSSLESLQRNDRLEKMASMVRQQKDIETLLREGRYLEAPSEFVERIQEFMNRFGDLSCPVTGVVQCTQGPDGLIRIILELARHPRESTLSAHQDAVELQKKFLSVFEGDELERARALLDLGRASYRLRDDDNIHLSRMESLKIAALMEAQKRLEIQGKLDLDGPTTEKIKKSFQEIPSLQPFPSSTRSSPQTPPGVKPRQLVGQPAGPGIARGRARVIGHSSNLQEFTHGEVLVCDAVDPNMTYVVPLASAIVERRGGMLIHGAIIAREYGLPCVTGVPDATRWIETGDLVTVDGFLGIVSVGSQAITESD